MPHRPRFDVHGFAYHTVSATHKRQCIFEEAAKVAPVLEAIDFIRERHRAYVLAYAILPDHLHLLIAPLDGNSVGDVMKTIKNFSARRINQMLGATGPVWQRSFYDRVIRGDDQLFTTIEYIHRNPVEAGLSSTPSGYLFSSAHPTAHVDLDAFFGQYERSED